MFEGIYQADYWLSRFIIQRGLGFIYLIAFLVALINSVPCWVKTDFFPFQNFSTERPSNSFRAYFSGTTPTVFLAGWPVPVYFSPCWLFSVFLMRDRCGFRCLSGFYFWRFTCQL